MSWTPWRVFRQERQVTVFTRISTMAVYAAANMQESLYHQTRTSLPRSGPYSSITRSAMDTDGVIKVVLDDGVQGDITGEPLQDGEGGDHVSA